MSSSSSHTRSHKAYAELPRRRIWSDETKDVMSASHRRAGCRLLGNKTAGRRKVAMEVMMYEGDK
jgi:hypothetical protein